MSTQEHELLTSVLAVMCGRQHEFLLESGLHSPHHDVQTGVNIDAEHTLYYLLTLATGFSVERCDTVCFEEDTIENIGKTLIAQIVK